MDQDPSYTSPPLSWALSLTEICARYMVSSFNDAISSEADPGSDTEIPREMSVAALCEADRMVRILSRAYRNKVVMENIDIIRLGESVNRANSHRMRNKTPDDLARDLQSAEEESEQLTEPSVITDRSDYVLLWYLPGLVSEPNQRFIWNQLSMLADPLRRSIAPATGRNWRASDSFFRPNAQLRGAINLSPAWFQQGRNSSDFEPEISALLKPGGSSQNTRQWISEMTDHFALLTACMAIMHPEMYSKGREAMVKLGERTSEKPMKSLIPSWPTVFNVVSVMVNRMSPLHTDGNGRPQWFDFLVTVGDYADLDMVIPTIARKLLYQPGTAVAFSGRLLQHGVRHVDGDRAVLSFYMRDNVHQFVDVSRSNYMEFGKIGRSAST